MYVKEYKYIKPTIDCGDHMEIEGLSRDGYALAELIEMIEPPVLTKRTAVLYAGGFSLSQMESRTMTSIRDIYKGSVEPQKTSMILKEGTVYNMHKWIGRMKNNHLVVYANINSNTCASSMSSICEAQRLLDEDIADEVVIIAEERTSAQTLRIFKEHRIPLVCGDALSIVVLSNNKKNTGGREDSKIEVTDTKWKFKFDNNPFRTSVEGYSLVDTDNVDDVDNVKPHGTNTKDDSIAELEILKGRNVIKYKPETGHTQGASALLELCMLIDDEEVKSTTLCTASGVGGFYGSCILRK